MSATDITLADIWEDSGPTLMARIVGGNGVNINQAAITSIGREIFDLDADTPDTAVDSSTLTVANVVFDTLQTDARWSKDSTGYNFRDVVAATIPDTADHRYVVEYLFTPTAGEVFWLVFQLTTVEVRTS